MERNDIPPAEKIKQHQAASAHYMENALGFLNSGELEKASEFMWGALAQALKALAALKGIDLRSHGQLWEYARQLALELQDPDIFAAFRQANSLHSNFYESGLMPQEVAGSVGPIRANIAKLLALIPAEVDER